MGGGGETLLFLGFVVVCLFIFDDWAREGACLLHQCLFILCLADNWAREGACLDQGMPYRTAAR